MERPGIDFGPFGGIENLRRRVKRSSPGLWAYTAPVAIDSGDQTLGFPPAMRCASYHFGEKLLRFDLHVVAVLQKVIVHCLIFFRC